MKNTIIFFTSFVFLFTSLVTAQENKIVKTDSIKAQSSNQPNSPQVEEGDVKITDGTNTLIRITDEGTFGAIEIKTGVPSTTTDKLYNDGGTLKFDGSSLGGGVTGIDDLSDGKTDTRSLFLGNGSGANDDGNHNANTAVGRSTLSANISGGKNTAYGYESLKLNTGNNNTANGFFSLQLNTTGTSNTAVGYQALQSNTTGNGNVALGFEAGKSELGSNKLYIENSNSTSPLIWGDFTDGSELVKINGDFHVTGNITGVEINDLTDAKSDGNTTAASLFFGPGAGENDDAGASDGIRNTNTAVGYQALQSNTTGYSNLANGYKSLQSNTTGYLNTANGYNALELNTEGFHNTANGVYSLNSNTTGETNTATGSNALRFNTSGNNNTASGMRALTNNTTGNNNTGVGKDALYSNATGNGNVALGFEAGKNEVGSNKLYIENSSSSTPLIWGDFANDEVKINGDFEVTGSVALGSNTTANGANSTAIGSYASTNNLSGSMILTDNSTTTVLNSSSINRMTMRFDKGYRLYSDAATSLGVFLSAGGGSWASISDSSKKENFQSVDGEELLNKISQFKLTTWNYKTQDPSKFRHYGPMAQNFYAAFGNDGIGVIGNDTTIASADFDGINLIAIQALEKRTKMQDASIKTLDKRIKTLEEENQNLKAVINENIDLRNEMNVIKTTLNKLIKEQPQLRVSSN